jgi:glutamate-1-semialdehyde 2,1-aminomutase
MAKPWTEAKKNLAGGVNSSVRAFKAVGGDPIFMSRGFGPFLFDYKNRRYIDYCLSWGAILWGHADASVSRTIQRQASRGTSFGTATEAETRLAIEIKKAFPALERLRFTSSGTEAVMSAIRVARGFTKKERIVKFEGCYHGHGDSLLVKAGSGLATFGTPDSAGIPRALAQLTTVLPYNDVTALTHFLKNADDVACVIVEPIAANMGVVPARREFLEALRTLTKERGILLIFDEVIIGYRVCYGGAQHTYGIKPDITILGKIIGGGLPVGAFGASAKIMDVLSPNGPVYQAGTLSGNPLSMAAGLSVLSRLSKEFYKKLNERTERFTAEAADILKHRYGAVTIQRVGSMFTTFFSAKPLADFTDVSASDKKKFAAFFGRCVRRGLYIPPSAFEASFLSAAHSEAELQKTLEILKQC